MVNQSQESPLVDLVLEAIKNLEVDKMGKVVQAIVAVEVIFLKIYFSNLRNGVFFRKCSDLMREENVLVIEKNF